MNIYLHPNRRNGSAVVIAVTLLGIMATLIVGNSLALRHLKSELNLIEGRQIRNLNRIPTPSAGTLPATPPRPAP